MKLKSFVSLLVIGLWLLPFKAFCNSPDNVTKHDETDEIFSVTQSGSSIINLGDKVGATALAIAIANNRFGDVKSLVKKGADIEEEDPLAHARPLHLASYIGSYEICDFLIKSGAEVNSVSSDGLTPLHAAAHKGSYKVLKLLVENGADVNAEQTKDGLTPLYIVSSKGDQKEAKYLIEKGAAIDAVDKKGVTPLGQAAALGNTEVVKLLIEKGANVNQRAFNGSSPLCGASYFGYLDIVTILVEKGAEINITALNEEFTPLSLAAMMGHLDVAKYLVKNGAWVSYRPQKGTSALYLAVSYNHVDIALFLLESGANPKVDNNPFYYPIIYTAINNDEYSVLKPLIDSGEDVNRISRKYSTPLIHAASTGKMESVKILVENGADIELKDYSGKTAIVAAKEAGFSEIEEYLISHR